LALNAPRRAAWWSFAVLSGFIAWTLLFLLLGRGATSWAGLIAVSMAPLFAAAPAVARQLAGAKTDPARKGALADAACLDQLAPSEAVLFVDRDGMLLAGTRAASSRLGLPAESLEIDATRAFHVLDRPALLGALRSCRDGAPPLETSLRLASGGAGQHCAVTIAASHGGTAIAMRIRELGEPDSIQDKSSSSADPRPERFAAASQTEAQNAVCDIDDAVAFALRRIANKAAARGIAVVASGEEGLSAACEQRACRRMLSILVEGAIDAAGGKAAISVTARRLKGIVLLQVCVQGAGSGTERAARLRSLVDQSVAREMAEAAGGTLLIEEMPDGARASIRLALAPPTMANRRQHQRFGVS
jgi:hypothetical protein